MKTLLKAIILLVTETLNFNRPGYICFCIIGVRLKPFQEPEICYGGIYIEPFPDDHPISFFFTLDNI